MSLLFSMFKKKLKLNLYNFFMANNDIVMFIDSNDKYNIHIKYNIRYYPAILGLFVTTHIIYNIILTVTTYTIIPYRETTIMELHHTIILHNQVWVYESETLIGNYITYILD